MAEKTKKRTKITTNNDSKSKKSLVLHNDDYHSFDYVIDALIRICGHTTEQASQCTYLIHNNGKTDVKSGTYEKLKPMAEALRAIDLKATIE